MTKKLAYYNDSDPFVCAWARELIKAGLVAPGEVDDRPIEEVQPADLDGFVQCHFFCGILGWSYALRLAGWPDDRAVWTGSCPCQPFSSAGTQAGGSDPRDLWPVWFKLIKECRPVTVIGEQVEAAIGHGWLDRLCDDLEAEDYAVGACGLPGASVGAYHIRNRLWFVADCEGRGQRINRRASRPSGHVDECGTAGELADTGSERRQQESGGASRHEGAVTGWRTDGDHVVASHGEDGLADTDGERRTGERLLLRADEGGWDAREVPEIAGSRPPHELGDTDQSGSCEQRGDRRLLRQEDSTNDGKTTVRTGASTFWDACDWLHCSDGKSRPVKPGTFPLAYGLPSGLVPNGDPSASYADATAEARVGRSRGYGNAIIPPLAAEFIEAYLSLNR